MFAHYSDSCIYKVPAYLSRLNEPITAIAGKNIDITIAGKKKPATTRKRKPANQLIPITRNNVVVVPNNFNPIGMSVFFGPLNSLKENDAVLTLLGLCHARASVCYGCGGSLRPNPASPLDLIVVTCVRRMYKAPDGQLKQTPHPQNAYIKFHGQGAFGCLYARIPGFRPDLVKLHDLAKPYLDQNHTGMILFQLGLVHLGPYLT